jgi:hypothetical protein
MDFPLPSGQGSTIGKVDPHFSRVVTELSGDCLFAEFLAEDNLVAR